MADSQPLLLSSSDSSHLEYSSIPSYSNANHQEGFIETSEVKMVAPEDRFYFVYIVFYILGLGTLLPWNFFITANEYWMYKLRNNISVPTSSPTTPSSAGNFTALSSGDLESSINRLQSLFENSLSICAMVPSVIFSFINTLLQQRVREKVRLLISLAGVVLLFTLTTVLVKVDTSDWTEAFFAVTMVSIVLLNSFTAIFQSSLFGIAAGFPPQYTQAVMAGQGMGGVFAAVAMIASLSLSDGATSSAFAYFLSAIAVTLATGVCYVTLWNNKFYAFFSGLRSGDDITQRRLLLERERKCSLNIGGGDDDDEELTEHVVYQPVVPPMWGVFKRIWSHCFAVFFTFFVTLSCFPSITASVKSMTQNSSWSTLYFTPVTCFLLFNATDWMGRTLAGHLHIPTEHSTVALLLCVVARAVFPALFALCNVQPRTTPVVFSNDAFFIVFMILFGLSNGYLGTLAMQYGPKRVDPELTATAGSMLAFSISLGLAFGAGFSFVIKTAI